MEQGNLIKSHKLNLPLIIMYVVKVKEKLEHRTIP